MKYKLAKKGSVGYNAAAGVLLERGKTYDLSAEQIEELGGQVVLAVTTKNTAARRKTKGEG